MSQVCCVKCENKRQAMEGIYPKCGTKELRIDKDCSPHGFGHKGHLKWPLFFPRKNWWLLPLLRYISQTKKDTIKEPQTGMKD